MNEPKIRFKNNSGSYPDWEKKILSDVASYRKDTCSVPHCRYVSTENMVKESNLISPYIDDDIMKGIRFQEGDILIGNIRPYLRKAWFANFDGSCSTDVLVIHSNTRVHNKFLFIYLSAPPFFDYVMQSAKGTKMPRGDKAFIMKYPLSIPYIEEQRKIADFLSTVDEKIALKQKKYAALVEAKKGLLQKIFRQEIRFKRDDGEEYPEWKSLTLKDVLSLIRNGYSYKADVDRNKRYKITRIETISSGMIDIKKLGSADKVNESYKLKDGDILFSHINSLPYIGNTAMYNDSLGEIYHGMNLLCLRANKNIILPEFLFLYLHTETARRFEEVHAKPAVNQCSLPISELNNCPVIVPVLQEQQKIADFLSAFDEKIETVRKELEGWKTVKKGLLQQMFY